VAKIEINLTKALLRAATDDRSWQRGVEYCEEGRVEILFDDGGIIRAKVTGSEDYKVRLWVEDGAACGTCSCPMGEGGVFCKHLVATGLTYLSEASEGTRGNASGGKAPQPPHAKMKPRVTLEDVRQYLVRQDPARLVAMIMEQIEDDDRLRERLLMKVASQGPDGLDVATFRKAIDRATDAGGFVDYRSAHDFTRGIDEVVESVAALLEDGHAAEVVELAEYALKRCENAAGGMDDSDGCMGGLFERLVEVHHEACVAARPDPEALACRLFEWELDSGWGTFAGASERYADVLGEMGLAIYRGLAQALWDKLPPAAAGKERGYDSRRYHLTDMMESFARADGNVDALVAIKSRDLSLPYHYLEIATILKEAGQGDKALEWAEKGVRAFPDGRDERLVDFLADEYHRRRRHDEAMDLIWYEFTGSPSLHSYQHLKEHADRVKRWPAWRDKALALIRGQLAKEKAQAAKPRNSWERAADGSLLVEIFLWEKNAEAAWQEAQAGGCSNDLWMQLARIRENDCPADAVAIYRRQIDPLANRKNNDAYREAADLLRRICDLMKRLGQENEFGKYLTSVRVAHKPKRNFMAMLDRMKP
jgi:uncharacterized Zn finger protein